MIRFLKDTRSGRATFLPLTSITKPQEFKNPESLKEKGVIGMADELVHIDAKYKNVAKAMLGRIVVVDNVDNAVKIARKFDYGIRMVTLEGELLVPVVLSAVVPLRITVIFSDGDAKSKNWTRRWRNI